MATKLPGGPGFVVLLAVSAALYLPLAGAEFAWDDAALVVGNRATSSWSSWPIWFSSDLWETSEEAVASGYYRPLMLASLWLDQALWGDSPGGHHLQNVAWHLAAVASLSWLLRQVVPRGALVGAAVFALHPVQTEAVAWVVARNDLMAAALSVLAVALLAPRRVPPWRLLAGGLAMLSACLSKEHAVGMVALLVVLDLARWGRPGDLRRWGGLGAAAAIFFVLRALADVGLDDLPRLGGLPLLESRPFALPTWIAGRVLLPWPLSVGGTLEYLEPTWWESVALLGAAFLGLVWIGLRGGRLGVGGLAIFALTFAPALLPLLTRGQLGERYFYLPMIGVAVGLAASVRGAHAGWWALVGLLGLGVSQRVPEWASGLTLWEAAVEDTPNGHAHANLAYELLRLDRQADALPHLDRALSDEPPYVDACLPVVLVPLRAGQVGLAATYGALGRERGCFRSSGFPGAYASAMAQTGQWELAAEGVAAADPTDERAGLVEAALALRAGDQHRLEEVASRFGLDPEQLASTAARLLAIGDPATWTPQEAP